ncbi:MAG: nucleotidyl transferase AbiEii/AbiGii toxin family protein [Candidatus Kapabacteria bacterium]|nr:nucleotidyl transferase AbiEii/AbiGii toxin family protein [Candidatus Kapabacteria bacterium]
MYIALLENVARSLDAHNVRYMIIGGQAVLIYGEPRLTRDIDITIDGTPKQRLAFVRDICTELSLSIPAEATDEFVESTYILPAFDEATGFQLKFIFSESAYEQQAMTRTQYISIRDYSVHYASAEDVIIHKLIANRPRDYEDIVSILKRGNNIDNEYVMQWLAEFDKGLNTDYVRRYEQLWADTVTL